MLRIECGISLFILSGLYALQHCQIVGTEFGISSYSTVSSVVQRVKRRLEKDKTLLDELRLIVEKVKVSQKRI